MGRTATLLLALALAGCSGPADQARAPQRGLAITGGTLIDGSGTPPLPRAFLVTEADRIVALGPQSLVSLPKGVSIVDARGRFVLPLAPGLLGEEAIAALERRVSAGSSPAQAIAAAVAPEDVPRVGRPANLLILDQDPTVDVAHLRAVHQVVRDGRLEPPTPR
jgi:imidazolonepropionase-like amidohydrolase